MLKKSSIAPVDLAQAAIGPGMAIFSRYTAVLGADDTRMSVRSALQDINAALDSYLSDQEAEFDPHTRFAITWFETAGMEVASYGTAETLAKARGVSVQGVKDAGIIESGAGKVRLRRRDELPDNWEPSRDGHVTVWECTQNLIRRLMDGSESDAAELMAKLGARAEPAKDLAYRLYGICNQKRWADEGYAYNALVASWPRLSDQARSVDGGSPQTELSF